MFKEFQEACAALRDFRAGKAGADALADALEHLLLAIASRDPELADLFDSAVGGSESEGEATVFLQGQDALEFERSGFCDICLRPAREWAEPDRLGCYEVAPALDGRGNLIGFLCPKCAGAE